MKIVVLNGPPFTGKDSIANIAMVELASLGYGSGFVKVSGVLKHMMQSFALYSMEGITPLEELESITNDSIKDQIRGELMYTTPRKFQIALSEKFFKPLFGPTALGHVARRRLEIVERNGADIAFLDCGFAEELTPIFDRYHADQIAIVRLYRQGVTFEGDSRQYLPNFPGVKSFEFHIASTPPTVASYLIDTLKKIGWIDDKTRTDQ